MTKFPPVILVTQYLGLGGLERMILNLSAELRTVPNNAWEPIVFVYDEIKGGATLHGEFEKLNIPVVTVTKEPGFSLQVVFDLVKLALRKRARVLHTHDLGALIYGVLAKIFTLGWIKICHTQHSFIHLEKAPRYKKYEKIFTAFASQVSTVSEALKSQYTEVEVDPAQVQVIPNGVGFSTEPLPHQILEQRKAVIQKHPKSKELLNHLDKVWVLCMARVHPKKGQNHVIETWAKLSAATRKKAVLILLGQPTSAKTLTDLQASIQSLNISQSALYAGLTYTPTDWIQTADVFASGSEFEGMPLGPIEAMGGGLGVWLSDIPGHKLLPIVSAQSPVFFDLNDLSAASQRLEAMIETLAPEVSAQTFSTKVSQFEASNSLRSQYGTSRMAARYADLYQKSCPTERPFEH